jgi:hypothetical protein
MDQDFPSIDARFGAELILRGRVFASFAVDQCLAASTPRPRACSHAAPHKFLLASFKQLSQLGTQHRPREPETRTAARDVR